MNNEKLIEQIDELIGMHRQLKTDGNDILSKVRCALINKNSDDYERGLNDVWELARKIGGADHPDSWDCDELYEIFGTTAAVDVFDRFSYQEALYKVEQYEKKKAEQEAKLVPGDVIVVKGMTYGDMKGIFVKFEYNDLVLFTRKGGLVRLVCKDVWNIDKTGDRVDISGFMGALYD